MKFWLGPAQVNQGGFKLCASQLPVTGDERRGVIPCSQQQFTVEGRGGHHASGVAGGYEALCRQVKGMSLACPTGRHENRSDQ